MAITRKEKEEVLANLIEELKNSKGVVFVEYRGVTVKDLDKIRKTLKSEGVKYRVIKVTLLKKAFEAIGIDFSAFKYSGPLAVASSMDEETSAPRALKGLSKQFPMLVFSGGLFEKAIVGPEIVEKFATLPSKEQLLVQLVSVIAGPARGLVTVLTGNTRNLLNVLNAIITAKGGTPPSQ